MISARIDYGLIHQKQDLHVVEVQLYWLELCMQILYQPFIDALCQVSNHLTSGVKEDSNVI